MGETLGNLSRGLDTYSYRQPLGVTAGEMSPSMRRRMYISLITYGCGISQEYALSTSPR